MNGGKSLIFAIGQGGNAVVPCPPQFYPTLNLKIRYT